MEDDHVKAVSMITNSNLNDSDGDCLILCRKYSGSASDSGEISQRDLKLDTTGVNSLVGYHLR